MTLDNTPDPSADQNIKQKEIQQLFIGLCVSAGIALVFYVIAGFVGGGIKHGLGDVLQRLTILIAIAIVARKYVAFIHKSEDLKKKIHRNS